MDKITERMLRMRHLSNNPVRAKDLKLSEGNGFIELTEQDWRELAVDVKLVMEGQKVVVVFEDGFSLKPVKIKTDDNGNATVNTKAEYEGGDAEKMNKKMVDNDKDGGTKMVKEDDDVENEDENIQEARRVGPVTDDQAEAGKIVHDFLTHGKKKYSYGETGESRREREDREYEEMMKKKNSKKNPDSFIKSSALRNAKITKEAYENKQEFDDTGADEYYGLDGEREDFKVPRKLITSINTKIKEISASIDHYDEKGYNDGDGDNSNKIKAIKALEQIKSNLSLKTEEGMKQAKLFFLTLMSPITDLFPADVVNFLAKGNMGDENNDNVLDKVEPFETKLKESFGGKDYMFTNEQRFNKYFLDQVVPEFDFEDEVAYRTGYNDYVDGLVKDGTLPPEAMDWTPPPFDPDAMYPKVMEASVRTISEIMEAQKKRKKDPCWKGYTQVGMKKKNGKEVPNCVPDPKGEK